MHFGFITFPYESATLMAALNSLLVGLLKIEKIIGSKLQYTMNKRLD